MGRITHYFKKFRLQIETQGLWATARLIVSFLWRRKFFLQFFVEAFEYRVLAPRRSISQTLIQKHDLKTLQSKRVAIYVSYDQESRVRDHVLSQVEFFCGQGYDVIFVTTSPELPALTVQSLRPHCAQVIHRQNVGYDFASYALGFESVRSKAVQLESLVVMNDSCVGPFFDFAPLLQRMRDAQDSVYGLSKSLEIGEHIQSYFFHFGAKVNQLGASIAFFDSIRILKSKWGIVRYFEIGSSDRLREWGIPLRALVDPSQPEIARQLEENKLTEPTREPLASRWVSERLLPFKKRSLASGVEFK